MDRDTDKKKSKITPENLAEAAALKAIWESQRDRLRDEGYGTQEKFGQHFGIGNQAAVGFFLNGKTALSAKAAAGFARGLKCSVRDFCPRLADMLAAPAPVTPTQPIAWPFEDLSRERWERLSERQKGRVEKAALDEVAKIESEADVRNERQA